MEQRNSQNPCFRKFFSSYRTRCSFFKTGLTVYHYPSAIKEFNFLPIHYLDIFERFYLLLHVQHIVK
jgi:hypothetical protein